MENGSGQDFASVSRADDADSPIGIAPIVAYARAIRAHRLVVVVIMLACVLGSAAWLAVRPVTYSATAELLISPLPETDTSFVRIPLIRDVAADPARPVATAAVLVDSPAVARNAAEELHGDKDAGLGGGVVVEARQNQNVVAITATASRPEAASRIANAYANSALNLRRERLRPLIAAAIARTEAELASVRPNSPEEALLQARLTDLETVRDGTDPTISFAQRAPLPEESNQTSGLMILALAVGVGFAIAAATAVMMELLVPGPIKGEDELRRAYPLPVLARVPRLARRDLKAPLAEVAPELTESYRTLRGQLDIDAYGRLPGRGLEAPSGAQVIAVVSASSGDGRTTTALGLAEAMIAVGASTLLLDADVRRPGISGLLGVEPKRDLSTLLVPGAKIEEAVTHVPGVPRTPGVGTLNLVAAPHTDNLATIERMGAFASSIVEEARGFAERVIIDTPALGEVSDALAFVGLVDRVVVVARIGQTSRTALENLRGVLERAQVRPSGYAVVSPSRAGPSVAAILERATLAVESRARSSTRTDGS
jgi:Mrp family chromosome partitioning ATPase